MTSPQQPNKPSLTRNQQFRADDAQEAITKAFEKALDQKKVAGIDFTQDEVQAMFTEIIAEHLTDDKAVDEEILEVAQGMRVLFSGKRLPTLDS